MSDEWKFFMCSMGDHLASILVDVGISKTIGKTPSTLATVRVTYQQPDDRGLPTNAEFDAVSALEGQLEAFVKLGRDSYVGRITSQGERTFFIYTKRDEPRWDKFVEQLAENTGYALGLLVEEDPEHSHYWKYLYPTPDDWQVIQDMDVCEALKKNGDDLD